MSYQIPLVTDIYVFPWTELVQYIVETKMIRIQRRCCGARLRGFLGQNRESSLSDEAHRADQAYHCQFGLCGLIWELSSILDRGDLCMSRRYFWREIQNDKINIPKPSLISIGVYES